MDLVCFVFESVPFLDTLIHGFFEVESSPVEIKPCKVDMYAP